MSSAADPPTALLCGIALLFTGCAQRDSAVPWSDLHYRVELLDLDLDPELVLESKGADFDGDGSPDQTIQTDTSLIVVMSSGVEFRYSVSEMAEDSATALTGISVLSFNRDGRYPSLALATIRDEVGAQRGLVHQQVLFNDNGRLTLKTVSDYPLSARDVDCARLKADELPVCFYASFGPDLGRSKLIEFDPAGLRALAADTAYLNFRDRISALYDGWIPTEPVSAREQVMRMRDVTLETIDSVLAAGWADSAGSFVDSVRTIAFGLSDRVRMYSTDITREARLPWPVELSQSRDRRRPPQDRWMDGYFMVGSAFLDFTGDGLLDLVAVGQHSAVFSAVQHADGLFIDAGYHGLPDEYHDVRGPAVTQDATVTVPPCVIFSMEEDSASKPDYLDCYDRRTHESKNP
jgi:hypothetical protein